MPAAGRKMQATSGSTISTRLIWQHDQHTPATDAAVDPTCTESGLSEGMHCSGCGETIVAQEVIEALGHSEEIDAAVTPTCTESGLSEGVHCSVCGETIVAQKIIAALGHQITMDRCIVETVSGEEVTIRGAILCGHDTAWSLNWAPAHVDALAFIGCTLTEEDGLRFEATFTAGAAGVTSLSAVLPDGFSMDDLCTVVVHSASTLTLPASLTALEDEAFVGMPSTEIVLPGGIKTIGARAFADNQNLVLINLPKSVAAVAPDAFSGCNHLTLLCTEGSFGAHYAQTYDIPCILIPAD